MVHEARAEMQLKRYSLFMLIIRLQRVGKKKFPTYRLIISEKTKDTQGTYLELLGNFNPHLKGDQLNVNVERVKYWISKGAQMSNTVNNLLIVNKIIEGKKQKAVRLTKKRQVKIDEKNKVKAEASAKAQPAAPEAPPASAPAVEEEAPKAQPAEEQKAEPAA